MHVISRKALTDFSAKHSDAEIPLDAWYRVAKKARWQEINDVRVNYPHADAVGTCTVFNIAGNKYRLITKIYYHDQVILIRNVLTHAEYNKEGWRKDCGC